MIKTYSKYRHYKYIIGLTIMFLFFLTFLGIWYVISGYGEDELIVKVLGLETPGDCTIIQYKDIEILIDASQNTENIKSFPIIEQTMSDIIAKESEKKWEYIVFTHPDKDHIGNAVNVLNLFGGYQGWKLGTIIDFDMKDAPKGFFNDLNEEYRNKRDSLRKNGVGYFSAAELSSKNKTKKFVIDENLSITILYNCYDDYEFITKLEGSRKELRDSSNRNDISVCLLINYKNQKLLFTGDIESGAELELINNHKDSGILENVTFFKANHHGSNTSNTDIFLDTIRPAYISISKMNSEKNHALNKLLNYTDYIYPTYVKYTSYLKSTDIEFEAEDEEANKEIYKLFGNQIFRFDGQNVYVETEVNSNKDNAPSILDACINYDSEIINWFDEECRRENIKDSVSVYIIDEGKAGYNNCSLVKYGHYDILIDCGSSDLTSVEFVSKLKKYIVDGNIEYLIVSHYHEENISQLIGSYYNGEFKDDGVFDKFNIGTIIYPESTNFVVDDTVVYKKFLEKKNKALSTKKILSPEPIPNYKTEEYNVGNTDVKVVVCGNKNSFPQKDENNYSLLTSIVFQNNKILFVGDLNDYSGMINDLESKNIISNATYLKLSNSPISIDNMIGLNEFITLSKPKYMSIGTPLNYPIANRYIFNVDSIKNIYYKFAELRGKKLGKSNISFCGYINENGEYIKVNGTLVYNFRRDGIVNSKGDRDRLVLIEDNF